MSTQLQLTNRPGPLQACNETCAVVMKSGNLNLLEPSGPFQACNETCAVVMKSGKLNLLEPSGPLQTCNGTDLSLPLLHSKNNELGVESFVLLMETGFEK